MSHNEFLRIRSYEERYSRAPLTYTRARDTTAMGDPTRDRGAPHGGTMHATMLLKGLIVLCQKVCRDCLKDWPQA